jgi:hypothetical protein
VSTTRAVLLFVLAATPAFASTITRTLDDYCSEICIIPMNVYEDPVAAITTLTFDDTDFEAMTAAVPACMATIGTDPHQVPGNTLLMSTSCADAAGLPYTIHMTFEKKGTGNEKNLLADLLSWNGPPAVFYLQNREYIFASGGTATSGHNPWSSLLTVEIAQTAEPPTYALLGIPLLLLLRRASR